MRGIRLRDPLVSSCMYSVTFTRALRSGGRELSVGGRSVTDGVLFCDTVHFETGALLIQAVLRAGLPIQIALQDLWGPLEVQAEQLTFLGFGELP